MNACAIGRTVLHYRGKKLIEARRMDYLDPIFSLKYIIIPCKIPCKKFMYTTLTTPYRSGSSMNTRFLVCSVVAGVAYSYIDIHLPYSYISLYIIIIIIIIIILHYYRYKKVSKIGGSRAVMV